MSNFMVIVLGPIMGLIALLVTGSGTVSLLAMISVPFIAGLRGGITQ